MSILSSARKYTSSRLLRKLFTFPDSVMPVLCNPLLSSRWSALLLMSIRYNELRHLRYILPSRSSMNEAPECGIMLQSICMNSYDDG